MPNKSKVPYQGPGTYREVIITGYPDEKTSLTIFGGLGTLVANTGRWTRTFVTDDGAASGSWGCGAPLK